MFTGPPTSSARRIVATPSIASLANPNYADAPVAAGYIHLRLGQRADAEQSFRQALERVPDSIHALLGLGSALRQLGKTDQAEAALRQALVLKPAHNGAMVALAHLLTSVNRLDEAVELLETAVNATPGQIDSLAALGHIHRRRGDREAALIYFRRAADADPHNSNRRIEIAVELRELGKLEDAAQIVDAVLTEHTTDLTSLMQRGLLLRRLDRRNEAQEAFSQLVATYPDHTQGLVELATEERALGRPAEAYRWIANALAQDENHLAALSQAAELASLADDAEGALRIYRRAIAAHPDQIWLRLNGARAAFESGDRADAFHLLRGAREIPGSHAEIAAMEIELLRQLQDWDAARDVLLQAEKTGQRLTFWLWMLRIQIEIQTGNYQVGASLIGKVPASSSVDFARLALLRGQIAEAQFDYDTAIVEYRESIQLNPSDAWAHFELSRAALMHLDLETARSELVEFTKLTKSALLMKGQSLSPSQSHVGQLLDEFRLNADALESLQRSHSLPLIQQLGPLMDLVRQQPDYTPASILTAIALRRHGLFSQSERLGTTATESPIPKHIVQFWDEDPPSDVVELMTTWQERHPEYKWTCFDNKAAIAFLESNYPVDVVKAYRRAQQPAQKADIFRLAYLMARGGVYVDADDRCLLPVNRFVRTSATLVLHQENYGTIGNNFMAATAEHPVLRRALEWGVEAMNRGDTDLVWLSTGPGLLTRAFVREWIEAPQFGWVSRAQIMDLGELQRAIGIHCPVRYKKTVKHWSRTSFGKGEKVRAIS